MTKLPRREIGIALVFGRLMLPAHKLQGNCLVRAKVR